MEETTINPNNSCRRSHSYTLTDPVAGEVICIDCGTVVSDIITEKRPIWGTYANNELIPRHGTSILTLAIYDQGLSTKIGRGNTDHSGRVIDDPSMKSVLERIRTWDLRTQTRGPKSSSRKDAFGQLDKLRVKLALPDSVVEKAAYIYRKVQQKKKTRISRTRAAATAACVYIACREASVPRTFIEIAEASNVKRREMWDAYQTIVLDLDLRVPSIDPIGCLVKLANKTGVSEKTKRLGVDYMRKVIHINVAGGKDPMGLAATVLYIASQSHGDRNKSQRYFADIAGVSDVTIKNRIQELRMKIPGLFTHNVGKKYS
jgi:transcription initiation factor TFIIB